MEVAQARVAKVKTMLADAASGDSASLAAITLPGAGAYIDGKASMVTVDALAPLKACTRKGPFTVSEDSVTVVLSCGGDLSQEPKVVVSFLNENIASVVFGPSAPTAAAGEGAE